MRKKLMALAGSALVLWAQTVCAAQTAQLETTGTDASTLAEDVVTSLDQIDMTKWEYQSEDDVYYQIGLSYCETPADPSYETLAIFVPGPYLIGTQNEDGTYTCEINEEATINGYSAQTAPIVMPIETPGYTAQAALSAYSSQRAYMQAGEIYVHAGCRGRDQGAPAAVTDLKAAIRYLRYCDDVMPGDAERIFVFGMSGGGAQSAIVGASGDSALYEPYLEEIGAVQGVSDAVFGSMDWCPITNLDSADEAYEWMMGVTRSGLSEEEQEISDGLAAAFAEYINQVGLEDPEGNPLTLEESEDGIYQAGSYYRYIKEVIETSLNEFLSDTEFPYDASAASKDGGFGGGGMGGPAGRGGFGGPKGDDGQAGDFGGFGGPKGEANSYEERDQITRSETSGGVSLSGTYETAQDYIDALNADGAWVSYDIDTNTATITSVSDFVKAFKHASKNLGAFDELDAGQGENILFGYGDGNGAHFDAILAGLLDELDLSYAAAYAQDLEKTDAVGNTVEQRVDMYTPLYYLLPSQDGYGESTPASYWRIRTGIAQSDTSVTTEVNLALALAQDERVKDVDFATVWAQQHVKAERSGDSTTNFIQWVDDCMANS